MRHSYWAGCLHAGCLGWLQYMYYNLQRTRIYWIYPIHTVRTARPMRGAAVSRTRGARSWRPGELLRARSRHSVRPTPAGRRKAAAPVLRALPPPIRLMAATPWLHAVCASMGRHVLPAVAALVLIVFASTAALPGLVFGYWNFSALLLLVTAAAALVPTVLSKCECFLGANAFWM